jgi:hypothetical protein
VKSLRQVRHTLITIAIVCICARVAWWGIETRSSGNSSVPSDGRVAYHRNRYCSVSDNKTLGGIMATRTLMIDDLDGSEDAQPIRLALADQTWEIDLSDANAERLARALEPFVRVARPVGRKSTDNGESALIRDGRRKTVSSCHQKDAFHLILSLSSGRRRPPKRQGERARVKALALFAP